MRPTLRLLLAATLFAPLAQQADAQRSFGGQPFGHMPHLVLPAAPVQMAPALTGPVAVWEPGVGITHGGTWHEMPNGDRLWRIALEVPGATAMSVEFASFELPEAALVFLYNEQGDRLGAYLGESGNGSLRTPRLTGDRITVEYYEPAEVQGEGLLQVGRVFASLSGAQAKAHRPSGPVLPDGDNPEGGGCTVVPPPEVDVTSLAYQVVIGTDPFCCFDDWDGQCQDLYDQLIAGCAVQPPATVDANSLAYLLTIADDPFCCEVEWDGICQQAYEDNGGTSVPTDCTVVPPEEVDTLSLEYIAVIIAEPDCCYEEWSEVCQDLWIEYTTPPLPENDAAITSIVNVPPIVCGVPFISPRVTIKNNGTSVLTSVIIIYGVGGQAPAINVWNGSLLPGQTYNHDLPPYEVLSGEHTLTVSSNSPNGLADEVPENDEWEYTFFMSNPAENVLFLLTPDAWGSDITWTLHSEEGSLLYSGGPYPNGQSGQTMEIPFCLTNGCFTFTINDLFGDGICCGNGQGGYVMVNDDGVVYAESDGQYGFQNIDEFCISGVGIVEMADGGSLSIFPNPTDGTLNVSLAGTTGAVVLALTDGTGRVVRERQVPAAMPLVTLSLDGLSNGLYLLSATHADGRLTQRVVLRR